MARSPLLPTLFLAHGSPMLALEGGAWGDDGGCSRTRAAPTAGHPGLFRPLGDSRSIPPLLGRDAGVIHDFGGFPEALYSLDYPAPGSPDLAAEAAGLLRAAGLEAGLDDQRALDHGAWVPLRYLLPTAQVPVVQLSLPRPRTPEQLLAAGRALAPLRQSGVLILGSGGVVHNLRRLDWQDASGPQPWALAFQTWVRERLAAGDAAGLADWRKAPGAAESVPTSEHLDPLFVALGAAQAVPEPVFEGWQLGSLSLESYRFA